MSFQPEITRCTFLLRYFRSTSGRRSSTMKEMHMATLTTYGLPVQVRSLPYTL